MIEYIYETLYECDWWFTTVRCFTVDDAICAIESFVDLSFFLLLLNYYLVLYLYLRPVPIRYPSYAGARSSVYVRATFATGYHYLYSHVPLSLPYPAYAYSWCR